MNRLLEWYNGVSDKIVEAEIEFILRPISDALVDGGVYVLHALTNVMPEIGAGIVIVCAVGIMITGNIPKWLVRMGVGLGGVVIWLLNA